MSDTAMLDAALDNVELAVKMLRIAAHQDGIDAVALIEEKILTGVATVALEMARLEGAASRT